MSLLPFLGCSGPSFLLTQEMKDVPNSDKTDDSPSSSFKELHQ